MSSSSSIVSNVVLFTAARVAGSEEYCKIIGDDCGGDRPSEVPGGKWGKQNRSSQTVGGLSSTGSFTAGCGRGIITSAANTHRLGEKRGGNKQSQSAANRHISIQNSKEVRQLGARKKINSTSRLRNCRPVEYSSTRGKEAEFRRQKVAN